MDKIKSFNSIENIKKNALGFMAKDSMAMKIFEQNKKEILIGSAALMAVGKFLPFSLCVIILILIFALPYLAKLI